MGCAAVAGGFQSQRKGSGRCRAVSVAMAPPPPQDAIPATRKIAHAADINQRAPVLRPAMPMTAMPRANAHQGRGWRSAALRPVVLTVTITGSVESLPRIEPPVRPTEG